MFYIPAGIYALAAAFFLLFGSGTVQDFDSKKYKKKFSFLYWKYYKLENMSELDRCRLFVYVKMTAKYYKSFWDLIWWITIL